METTVDVQEFSNYWLTDMSYWTTNESLWLYVYKWVLNRMIRGAHISWSRAQQWIKTAGWLRTMQWLVLKEFCRAIVYWCCCSVNLINCVRGWGRMSVVADHWLFLKDTRSRVDANCVWVTWLGGNAVVSSGMNWLHFFTHFFTILPRVVDTHTADAKDTNYQY